ncbi:uncharacterized protein METZ01_LOCUS94002 [marine metagenome]|uniref:Uncharacterized protein n=1 Tax=marine metagenome TaxID=408172 RepID=A0A381VN10_9ZZZZ
MKNTTLITRLQRLNRGNYRPLSKLINADTWGGFVSNMKTNLIKIAKRHTLDSVA